MPKAIPETLSASENRAMHSETGDFTITKPLSKTIIEGPVSGDRLSTMAICPQMNNFADSYTQLQNLVQITELPRGGVYIARRNRTIIGYVTFHKPDDDYHWGQHSGLIEMGGIEVARQWRCCHVATALLKFIFNSSYWDNYIVMSIECCRHWDLEGNNLRVWEYRGILDKLLGLFNFSPSFTNMYDILEHPANTLMTRQGKKVTPQNWALFKRLSHAF